MLPSAKLNDLSLERCVPVSVIAELTRRCPLSCRHCYLPETRGRAKPGRELTTARWKNILDQLAEAGALYLVFTGGEPLLRPDLPELCRRAKELNFDIRIFSTGFGLTAGLAREFREAGVSAFEISFYGRPALHDSVTGLKGSFKASLAAARLLKRNGLKVKLKTPLMKLNAGQAAWLQELAGAEGFELSFDPVLVPANDGDTSALAQRLTGPELARTVKKLGSTAAGPSYDLSPAPPAFSADFLCGAGRNVCAVGPGGELYSCLQLPVKLGNLARRSFKDIWKNSPWLKKWRRARVKDLNACSSCAHLDFCSRCPGVSLLEEGDMFAPNKPACEMAEITHRRLKARAGN
ncbi:MAG: radical SAM protein [Elusimicrobia bacterium]|nr:radical SAM protein [Elusimicrobiota bacterium]